MPDLSAYISFTVKADITNILAPVFVLADNSAYPTGVPATLTGIFTITQPDGMVRTGNWASPDVVYSSGSLQPASIALRLDTGNLLQQGVYTIVYQVLATGYTVTTLTRTFTIAYTKPTQILTENFNLVTPVLQYLDGTNYNAGSFTQSITRAWSSVMSQGTITGSTSTLDLSYGGSYYDCLYTTTLTSNVVYSSTVYNYLSIADKLVTTVKRDIYAMPTQSVILTGLTVLKAKVDAANCAVQDDVLEGYEYAFILWRHANSRICNSDFLGVDKYYTKLLSIFQGNQVAVQTHTNAPIAPYVYTCDTGGSGTIVNPTVIEVYVGTPQATALGIIAGNTTVTIASLVNNNIEIISDGLNMPGIPTPDGNTYFTKVYSSSQITFSSQLVTGQYLRIKTLTISASPTIIEVIVGSTAATLAGITNSTNTVTNSGFANKYVQVVIDGINISGIVPNADNVVYFTKPFASNTLTFYKNINSVATPINFTTNSYIKIQTN